MEKTERESWGTRWRRRKRYKVISEPKVTALYLSWSSRFTCQSKINSVKVIFFMTWKMKVRALLIEIFTLCVHTKLNSSRCFRYKFGDVVWEQMFEQWRPVCGEFILYRPTLWKAQMKVNDKISLILCLVATHKSYILALEGKSI